MKNSLYMAVDLGTSFIKSGVYSLNGSCLAGWTEPVNAKRPGPGIFIQEGEMLYTSVLSCIRHTVDQLTGNADKICAVVFSGQMAGAIAVDENWNDVTTWSCSLDGRYLSYADEQRRLYADDIYEISGTNAPVMCSKYAWFKDKFPEQHKRIAKYIMLNGYMIGKMSGAPIEQATIDYSMLSWTGLADIRNRCWSDKICSELGIDQTLLPEISTCTTTGGYLHPDVAKKTGLQSGIPLIIGAGDKISGCVGTDILHYGDMIFEAASYGGFSCLVKDVRMDLKEHRYDVLGSTDSSSYYLHTYLQGSGITLDWFINEFARRENEDVKTAFQRTEKLAGSIPPGSENLMAIGLLGGSAIPFDSETRGLFFGHTWAHKKEHFYRALLEGFSYDLTLALRSISEQYPEFSESPIKIIGGGAKSSIWPQILADVTGHVIETLDRSDVALWGSTILAANATGEIDNIHETSQAHIRVSKRFYPNQKKNHLYQPYINLYKKLSAELHDRYQELNHLNQL